MERGPTAPHFPTPGHGPPHICSLNLVLDATTWYHPPLLSSKSRKHGKTCCTPIEVCRDSSPQLHPSRRLTSLTKTYTPKVPKLLSEALVVSHYSLAMLSIPFRCLKRASVSHTSYNPHSKLTCFVSGEAPEGPEVLQNEQLHPTYNVTVHRRKLHAVTQLPSTVIDGTPTRTSFAASTSSLYSTLNTGEDTVLHASAQTSTRKRRQTMDEGRLMQNLSDDPAMLDALRLYYDKDPSHMFSNSPSRPEIGPRSSSAGNLTTRSVVRVVDTTIQSPDESLSPSSASTLDRTLDESFLVGPDSNYIATAPLNVPSVGISERFAHCCGVVFFHKLTVPKGSLLVPRPSSSRKSRTLIFDSLRPCYSTSYSPNPASNILYSLLQRPWFLAARPGSPNPALIKYQP